MTTRTAAHARRKVALALILLECLEFVELPMIFAICCGAAAAADP